MRLRLAVGLLACAAPAVAQAPLGPEILIGPGGLVHVAGQPGGFVTVWHGANGLEGRRFNTAGDPLGSSFVITSGTGNASDGRPGVSTAPDGSFVVVWSAQPIPGSSNVRARRYDAGGAPLGPDFQVNQSGGGFHSRPSVAVAPDGTFVVAWDATTTIRDAYARRFDASGAPLGDEFQINTVTTGYQGQISVYAAPDGGFAAFWFDVFEVHGRRFGAGGQTVGPEFTVNSYTGMHYAPAAFFESDGSFTVVWAGASAADATGVSTQHFDAAGARVGAELRVNATTRGYQERPDVAPERDGRFAVVWRTRAEDGAGSYGMSSQLLDAEGRRLGSEAKVSGFHDRPAISSNGSGRLMVVWGQGGQARGQVFGGFRPVALDADASGNRVAEPGETVALAPTWLNTTGATVATGGTITAFTGPAGGTYTIVDASADYGTLADGAQGSCGADCFALRASAAARPLTHWDASVTETLGTAHHFTYALHLGDSFADVPRSNLFYRGVETLLHRGVTAGCAAAAYCPTASTTREQMAAFVLAGKEGGGFSPRPCGTPVFTDVPAASPFCPAVEELFRRGVVTGCGGGAYCPVDAVTREQMAIFVLRTLDPALDPPACTTPVFADVPPSSPYCRWIEELARRGVVAGCGGGNYCPQLPVTREQMGAFITDTFGITLYGP